MKSCQTKSEEQRKGIRDKVCDIFVKQISCALPNRRWWRFVSPKCRLAFRKLDESLYKSPRVKLPPVSRGSTKQFRCF
eukprot:2189028-Amphidinium_carterae.1